MFALVDDHEAAPWAETAGADLVRVTPEVLDRVASTQHPRGPVAVFAPPVHATPSSGHALVLWEIGDPGNAGTLIRTAAAFGAAVIASAGTVDLWAPKVLRSAAGAHFATTVDDRSSLSIEELRDDGYQVIATVAEGGDPVTDVSAGEKSALVIGAEAHGLPPDVVTDADARVTIPMIGTESLNAAVAGSITAFVLFGQGRSSQA
jgi:TrmH family RNA methyltransferase